MADNPAAVTFTGDPDIDRNIANGINSMLQQNAAQAQAAEHGQNPNPQPQGPQPWKVAVQGREYTFNSPQELSQALEATFNQFQNTLASQQPAPAAPLPQHADETPKFDVERYIDTMKQNPIAAQEYLDSHRYFDGKVEKPSELIKNQLAQADQNARLLAVYQFKEAHPEYQGNQQAAGVINKLREELNLPFDFNGLEAAYALARQRNMIQVPAQYPNGAQPGQPGQFQQPPPQNPFAQQQPPQPPNPYIPNPPSPYAGQSPYGVDPRAFNGGMGFGGGNNPFLAPPPGLPGRGGFPGGAPDFASQAENLSPEQIQQIFAMAGQRGPGFPNF
jgi:hypothetical protein